MSNVKAIEIDASPWLMEDGSIEVNVYIGENASEPCFEDAVNLKDLVNRSLESYTISGKKIPDYHYEDVKLLLENLKKVYEHALKRSKELGIEVI